MVLAAGLSVPTAWAQADTDRIASNLAPVGEICLAGDPCTEAPGVSTPSSLASSAPASTASQPAAPAQSTAAQVDAATQSAATSLPAAAQSAASAASDFDVAGTYQLRCFACHGTGAAGAPVMGDAEAWNERMAKGMDAVMENAINGIGAMPARGLCMDCSDDQISALIDYMVANSQ